MKTELKNKITNFVNQEAQLFINNFYTEHYNNKVKAPKLTVTFGRKYAKILRDEYEVWGFVSLENGDLLKPASWNKPATHSRGNVLNGTAVYDAYGPAYIR